LFLIILVAFYFVLYSALGDVEAIKVTVDLTLTEYRAFIERINAQSMYEVDHLMRESTDFEYTYKHFLACQGKSVSTDTSRCCVPKLLV
jgi:hypothetical protein